MGSVRLEKLCIPPPLPGGLPWLVTCQNGEEKERTFTTLWPKHKSFDKAIPELHGKRVQASCYGWLLLQKVGYCRELSLWNPVTLETISLPLLEQLLHLNHNNIRITSCVVTSSPDEDDDFGVFVFCQHVALSCHPRRDENPTWRVDELEVDGEQVVIDKAIAYNRVIYALGRQSLMTITPKNPADDDRSSICVKLLVDLPTVFGPKCIGYSIYLLQSCGQVYYVSSTLSHSPRNEAVEVWELDLDNTNWVEVKSLNNRLFFLGNDCCTWCWATPGVEGNTVIFPFNFFNSPITLCQHHLKDRTVTICKPCSISWKFFWFSPHHRRISLRRPLHMDQLNIPSQNAAIAESKELPKQNQPTTTGSTLDRIPLDIILQISEYFHWFDYLNFRTTCQSYRSIPRHSRGTSSSMPLFVHLTDNDGLFKVISPMRNEACSIIVPQPPFGAYYIECCKEGWLLLYSSSKSFRFFNLFTRARWSLPSNDDTQCFISLGCSARPDSSDCVTVGIGFGEEGLTIWYFRSGEQSWESVELDCGLKKFYPSACPPVYHNRGFYFLDKKGRLGVFKLMGKTTTWRVYGRPQTKQTRYQSFHLVECDGQLFSVFIGEVGMWMQVFMFDEHEKWVKVESLGNHTFFISPSLSTSMVAREPGMGNRIYLPRLYANRFMFYSLETCKYGVDGTDISMDNFCQSKQPYECSWV